MRSKELISSLDSSTKVSAASIFGLLEVTNGKIMLKRFAKTSPKNTATGHKLSGEAQLLAPRVQTTGTR